MTMSQLDDIPPIRKPVPVPFPYEDTIRGVSESFAVETPEPPRGAGPSGAGSGSSANCPLSLTEDRPEGYSEVDASTKGWVNWGTVNSVVPSNVAESFPISEGRKVWIRATTNGAIPLRVSSAEIGSGSSLPADVGGTSTTPPTETCYLLGEVLGDGDGTPFTLISSGCGALGLEAVAVGFSCVLASSGDPGATPPIPPSPGGVQTNYELRWVR